MDIHPLPAPPFSFLRFSSFVGLSLKLFRWLLRLVSLPQSSAKYSFFIFLHLSFSLALLALLFLSFFLSFLRLFRYLFRFLMRAPPSGTVCVSSPVPKSSFSRVSSRGPAADKQRLANKAMLARWMRSETSDRVPVKKLLHTLSNPLF